MRRCVGNSADLEKKNINQQKLSEITKHDSVIGDKSFASKFILGDKKGHAIKAKEKHQMIFYFFLIHR